MTLKDETVTIETEIQETLALLFESATRNDMLITGDCRVSEFDAAKLLGLAHESLSKRRALGKAPPHYDLPVGKGRVSYRLPDIALWISEKREFF